MGQHYLIVNIDKKQFLHPHKCGDGLKLLEFGCSANGTLTALAILLADGNNRGGGDLHSDHSIIGSWAGDRIVVAGDYADEGKFTADPGHTLYRVAHDEYQDISRQALRAMVNDCYLAEEMKKTPPGKASTPSPSTTTRWAWCPCRSSSNSAAFSYQPGRATVPPTKERNLTMTDTTMPSLPDQAELLLARIKSTNPDHEPFSISSFVQRLLAHYGRIAVTWEIADVQDIRPDLTRAQAWEVLEQVADHHDAEWGISWTTLQTVADDLFPRDGTTSEAEEA